jgi:hypothetical protein
MRLAPAVVFLPLVLVLLQAPAMVAREEKKAAEKETVYNLGDVHTEAENAIAADKKFGTSPVLVSFEVMEISKAENGYSVTGAAAFRIGRDRILSPVVGGKFGVSKSNSEPFAKIKSGQRVIVRAKFTGTAKQSDAVDGYVVTFSEAEFVKLAPQQ